MLFRSSAKQMEDKLSKVVEVFVGRIRKMENDYLRYEQPIHNTVCAFFKFPHPLLNTCICRKNVKNDFMHTVLKIYKSLLNRETYGPSG